MKNIPVGCRRFFFLMLLTAAALTIRPGSLLAQAKTQVHVVRIDNEIIHQETARRISLSVDRAEKSKAECLIIELNTPGGELESTRTIVEKLSEAKVPVVVYVTPKGARAGSAGVFISYASHLIAMAPKTRIGAAHPVALGASETWWQDGRFTRGGSGLSSDEILNQKVLEDTVVWIKMVAQDRGRNVEWLEKSVRLSATLNDQEAYEQKVADILAKDQEDLLKQMDGRRVKIGDSERLLHTVGAELKYYRGDILSVMTYAWGISGLLVTALMIGLFVTWVVETMGAAEVPHLWVSLLKRGLFVAGVAWGGLYLCVKTEKWGFIFLPLVVYGIALAVLLDSLKERSSKATSMEQELKEGKLWQCPSCQRINPGFVKACSRCNHKYEPAQV